MSLIGSDREDLRRELLDLGFDEVRFASAGPLPGQRLRTWLEQGWQADMAWMDRTADKRLDPGLVLEGATSIVLFGVNYLPGKAEAARQDRWARYALYEDYHDTVLKTVRQAGEQVADRLGLGPSDWKPYVDTGPVMERAWSARAGLGWQGKNGMLISRRHGNWLFLAALLVRAPIEADSPLAGGREPRPEDGSLGRYCGKCVRCLDACPTGAIAEPGLVDARLCLSYQNIENKGAIPRELRVAMGSRIFGCDICLDVCPWNRFAQAGRELLLAARHDIADLNLIDLLTLTPERFAEVFRRTPFKRLKRERLLRNACVVAGNLDEVDGWKNHLGGTREDLVRILVDLAGSSTPLVREHAVWAVHRLESDRAVGLLAEARAAETDAGVLEEYGTWGCESGTLNGSPESRVRSRES